MDAVEEVKSRLALEDIAGEYMQLKRSGRNYKALSPFSSEKSPSFMVSPEKQIWHDFSSGKGGNVFSLVMELEGLDFRGALELLARKAGVDLDKYSKSSGANSARKKRLLDLLDLATKFYQAQLKVNTSSIEYIMKKRRFSADTVKTFRLGYSPNSGRALIEFVSKHGYDLNDLKDAGLSTMRRDGPSDMFRGRIMVPLSDAQGSVIGFTARLLVDDPDAPKYINTPATMLYDKSRHVFGLFQAKEAIRKSGFVVVAEGNLDVIASWQANLRQIVATAGTAMTAQQIKSLSRFTADIRLAYDQDKAGQNAAERAIAVAQGEKVSLQMITVPSGKDPDELIRQDKKLWEKAVSEPEYAVDWLIERYRSEYDITSVQGKKAVTEAVVRVLSRLGDSVEVEHYLKKLSALVEVPIDALRSKMTGEQAPLRKIKSPTKDLLSTSVRLDSLSPMLDCILVLSTVHPSLRVRLKTIPKELFEAENRQRLYGYLCSEKASIDLKELAKELKTDEDYVKILSLQYDELYGGSSVADQIEEFEKLRTRIIEQYVRLKKQQLTLDLLAYEQAGRDSKKILQEIKLLDDLLS